MTLRQRRALAIGLLVIGLGTAVALALMAFRENLMLFYTPTEMRAGQVPADVPVRVGGMVERGSVQREPGSLRVRFSLTDLKQRIEIRYDKILPDLFREGQGIVAQGRWRDAGVFEASEVLAKHDENYMPPEVAAALDKNTPALKP